MVQNETNHSSIYSSGFDLWIFSKRNIHLKSQITWALNLQPLALERPNRPFAHAKFKQLAGVLNFEMGDLPITTLPNAPLLIESSQLLPVPRVAIINDSDWPSFKDSLRNILKPFNVKRVRVFLPPDCKQQELSALKCDSEIQWVMNESNV